MALPAILGTDFILPFLDSISRDVSASRMRNEEGRGDREVISSSFVYILHAYAWMHNVSYSTNTSMLFNAWFVSFTMCLSSVHSGSPWGTPYPVIKPRVCNYLPQAIHASCLANNERHCIVQCLTISIGRKVTPLILWISIWGSMSQWEPMLGLVCLGNESMVDAQSKSSTIVEKSPWVFKTSCHHSMMTRMENANSSSMSCCPHLLPPVRSHQW